MQLSCVFEKKKDVDPLFLFFIFPIDNITQSLWCRTSLRPLENHLLNFSCEWFEAQTMHEPAAGRELETCETLGGAGEKNSSTERRLLITVHIKAHTCLLISQLDSMYQITRRGERSDTANLHSRLDLLSSETCATLAVGIALFLSVRVRPNRNNGQQPFPSRAPTSGEQTTHAISMAQPQLLVRVSDMTTHEPDLNERIRSGYHLKRVRSGSAGLGGGRNWGRGAPK